MGYLASFSYKFCSALLLPRPYLVLKLFDRFSCIRSCQVYNAATDSNAVSNVRRPSTPVVSPRNKPAVLRIVARIW